MQISFNKTNAHHNVTSDRPRQGTSFPVRNSKRPLGWKPQPSGLTRDETRELILEMIG